MKALEIQADIKRALAPHVDKKANADIWNLSKALHQKYLDDIKAIEAKYKKEDKIRRRGRKLTEDERQDELTRFLDAKLLDGTLTAAELAQFKDIYGLKSKERDIIIETINFADAEVPLIKGDLD